MFPINLLRTIIIINMVAFKNFDNSAYVHLENNNAQNNNWENVRHVLINTEKRNLSCKAIEN